MYRLLCDETLRSIWDDLPDDASMQLTLALDDVCRRGPYANTRPAGVDDGIHRRIVCPLVTAVIAVNRDKETVRIYEIKHRA